MTDIRCIGICAWGGDASGLNVIRAAVKCAFLKTAGPEGQLVQTANAIGISFGD